MNNASKYIIQKATLNRLFSEFYYLAFKNFLSRQKRITHKRTRFRQTNCLRMEHKSWQDKRVYPDFFPLLQLRKQDTVDDVGRREENLVNNVTDGVRFLSSFKRECRFAFLRLFFKGRRKRCRRRENAFVCGCLSTFVSVRNHVFPYRVGRENIVDEAKSNLRANY